MEGPDPEVAAAIERGNSVVFMDVVLGADAAAASDLGRIKIELFVKDVSLVVLVAPFFLRCDPLLMQP